MKKRKLLTIISLVIVAVLLFAACGRNESDNYKYDYGTEEPGYYPDEEKNSNSNTDGAGSSEHQQIVMDNPDGRKLIYTVNISIYSQKYDEDYALIIKGLREYGGYIYSETTSGTKPEKDTDSGRKTEIVLKVPVENLDAFLTSIEENTTISKRNVNVEDTSDRYYDTEHRIKLLEERYERLEGYLKEATNVEEIITIETELSDILYQLDNLKGQVRGLDNLVKYSTLSINLNEVVNIASIPHDNPDLFDRMGNALVISFRAVVDFLSGLLVFLAGSLPVLILLAILTVIIIVIVKVSIKASQKRKMKKYQEQQELYRRQQEAMKAGMENNANNVRQ